MNLCLEYTINEQDLVNIANDSRSRLSKIVRLCISLCLFIAGIVDFFIHGLSSGVVMWWCLAALVSYPIPITLFVASVFYRRVTRLDISDEGLRPEWKEGSHLISWSEFCSPDAIKEQRHNFILNCGRGMMIIPKRAFTSSEDLAEFREFVGNRFAERQCVTT